jgi:hypothetical protein
MEIRGETNLELEAQKIKDFTGGQKSLAKMEELNQMCF